MAERNYTLPTDKSPTFWNINAGVGATIGIPFLIPGMIFGALIGGFLGKHWMAQEQREGIKTEPAGFWNKGVVAGWGLGQVAALPVLALGAIAGAGSGAILIGCLIAGTIGAIYGGSERKQFLNERYETAKALHEGQQLEASLGKARTQETGQSISLEEMRELESRMKQNGHGGHAQQVTAQRDQIAELQL